MAYRYNSWKHRKDVVYNDRSNAWEVVLFSAYSGRKLKVYARCKTLQEAEIISSAIKDLAEQGNG